MTRKQSPNTRSNGRLVRRPPASTGPSVTLWHWLMQCEVWGLILIAIGVVTITALTTRSEGRLTDAWSLTLRQIFGLGAYPIALLITISGLVLLLWNSLHEHINPRWQAIVGYELLFVISLGLLHIFSDQDPLELAQAGQRGGFIGWALWQLLVPLLGKALSALFLLILAIVGGCLVAGITWQRLVWRVRWVLSQAGVWLRARISPPAQVVVVTNPRRPSTPPARPKLRGVARPQDASPSSAPSPAKPQQIAQHIRASARASAEKPSAVGLPAMDILTPDEVASTDDADARMRAQTIEDTLEAFGIPAQVTEWHRGPTVTQFDVEPGYVERQERDGSSRRFKIRVSKILALTNDLALALAAAPIRIEAPVPGRAVVGIEVPNAIKSMVGLRGLLESSAFRKMRSPLRIALGRDVSGEAVATDLAAMPHLLIAGTTGSGKSVCLNAIIASLLFFDTPDQVKLLMIDPKRVEFSKYNGIPHLIAPVVVDIEKVIVALRWVTREMDRRYAEFAQAGARNLEAYNKAAKGKSLEPMSMIVVIIDELADLMLAAPDDVERTLCRLAQMARATGIHLVIATQRPSVDVVTGLIKANFPARISFAVTSQIDSRVVLDTPGAEKLLGRGDMLFMAPDSPKLQRIQGCFVSDKELETLVSFWKAASLHEDDRGQTAGSEPAPWEEMSMEDVPDDALLRRATELVRQHNQASASFLQRQMRIGYPRAARLIDQLERAGVIGPAEAAGRSRTVLVEGDSTERTAVVTTGKPEETS
jgi:DNA segregation ATPase FtsK/SpoIIIE, S-DNA-T family